MQQRFGGIQLSEFGERASHALADAAAERAGFEECFQVAARLGGPLFEHSLAGLEPFHQHRPSMRELLQLAFFELGASWLGGLGRSFGRLLSSFLFFAPGQLRCGFRLVPFDAPPQFLDGSAAAGQLAERAEAIQQQDAEPMFLGPSRPQLLGQSRRLSAAIPVPVRAGQVVFEFALAFVDGVLDVRAGRRHVPQVHQLFESLG